MAKKAVLEEADNIDWEELTPKRRNYSRAIAMGARQKTASRSFNSGLWRKPISAQTTTGSGIQVFAPVDPYTMSERKEFRSAVDNAYVYRAMRIQTTFVAGQGYTTNIVPRKEEDLPDEQLLSWQQTTQIYVPYWDREVTPEELKDKIDKMALDLDLADSLFNAYFYALEQGRCAIAMLPLNREELANGDKGDYQLPEKLSIIRPEFTMRPIIDFDMGELIGVEVVGLRSDRRDNILEADRMIYLEHGFNNELFSDHYGDSKVARISDISNTLNIILNQDYERGAEHTWHQPKVFSVPIHPQDAGREDEVLTGFLKKNSNSKGQDIAVVGPSKKDEPGVTLLSAGTNSGDVGALEIMRTGLIKSIITAFGIPGFMLSEGDIGKLGGNANIEEVDMYLNTEVRPEALKLEATAENQFYDQILCILFKVDSDKDLPVKIKHKFNKPKIQTLLTPDMVAVMERLAAFGMIDESGMREILGLEELKKETLTKGGDISPGRSTWIQNPSGLRYNLDRTKGWNIPREDSWNSNQPSNLGWGVNQEGTVAGAQPKGWAQVDVDTWLDPTKQIWKRQKTHLVSTKWSKQPVNT